MENIASNPKEQSVVPYTSKLHTSSSRNLIRSPSLAHQIGALKTRYQDGLNQRLKNVKDIFEKSKHPHIYAEVSATPPLPLGSSSSRSRSSLSAPSTTIVIQQQDFGFLSDVSRLQDRRVSSTQSLTPSKSAYDGRRTLLLVFIHGFLGSEASFQSFPYHVHKLLTEKLSSTHVIQTKIYPRYKSRNAIQLASSEFSEWLEPHENPETDVVILGHSLGGILGVEVALQTTGTRNASQRFKHRILGTVNFDTPFLGMEPHVISSGIRSVFRSLSTKSVSEILKHSSAHETDFTSSIIYSSMLQVPGAHGEQLSLSNSYEYLVYQRQSDPNFDPKFSNDTTMPERTGWNKFSYFMNKHSSDFFQATQKYFRSHIEFGWCLTDYQELKERHAKLLSLEYIATQHCRNSKHGRKDSQGVRFLNYYTESTGNPKKPQKSKGRAKEIPLASEKLERKSEVSDRSEPLKGRNFCRLPMNRNGEIDKCWVRIFIGATDEIGAHCGLFASGSHYEDFVANVGTTIERWVDGKSTW